MIQSSVIDNGMRVVTEKVMNTRALAIGMFIDSSPRSEPAAKAGLSHLLEHSLFHGTSSRTSMDISRLIDTVGGRVSAFTGRDYTCFSSLVMDDHRTYVLDLFSDMILNSIFPKERFEHEKQVALHEQQSLHDSPGDYIAQLLKESVWPAHPLGRPIDGYPQTVEALTREDLIYYLHTTYLPGRITLAMAGNLEHEDIVAQVRDCFWRLSGSVEEIRDEKPLFTPCTIERESGNQRSYFTFGLPAPEYASPFRYDVHLLNTILGGGLSSRLFRNLREEHGLVYDIGSEYHAYKEGGILLVSGSTSPELEAEAREIIRSELLGLFTGEKAVTEEELWQARMYTVGQHHVDTEDLFTKMSRLLTQTFYFGDVIPASEVVRGLEEVSLESLQAVCRSYFHNVDENIGEVVSRGVS